MTGVLTTLGHVIAIGALVLFVAAVFYGMAHDVARWFDDAEPVRMSDTVHSFTETELAEDDRMETLRLQLDEVWEDDEDPRDAFADAALDYYDWVTGLPERKVAS